MTIKSTNTGVQVSNITSLDLAQTLDCGQSFRWVLKDDGYWHGTAFGKYISAKIEDNTLYINNTTTEDFQKIWKNYFDLNLNYNEIRSDISKIHPVLCDAAKYAPGIRILQQEPFEALCSFIISQNNNIARIKGIVARLCENFGDEIIVKDAFKNGSILENEENTDKNINKKHYSFPSAEKLASLEKEDLAPLRAGFRDKYIIDCAQKVAGGEVDLELCRTLEYEQAQKELMKIKGVGTKVADCVLLYGLHRLESFPLDVWMKRAMEKLFPTLTPKDFGKYGGIAQQYIFHYSRMHPQLFN